MKLSVRNLGKSFGVPPTVVLHDVSFEIPSGSFVTLTGRSGSGKSTLLYIISTLDKPSTGSVSIDDQLVSDMSQKETHRFRNLHMGFVFQFHHLLPELSALENVLMPAVKTRQQKLLQARAEHLLENFGLKEKTKRFPRQLSGGEQQRVAIARALIMSPKFLFADEPTGNLDSANGNIVMGLLKRINQEEGTTVIYVTHDTDYAEMASRKIHLVDGKVSSGASP